MGGKDGWFLDDVAPKSTRQHEEVKGDGKKGSENAHPINVEKSDEPAGMSSSPNKRLFECGGGEGIKMVVEGGLAPYKTTTMVEEVGATGKVNTKVDNS
ncbi:unnamed protein product [Sphagnum balticum]